MTCWGNILSVPPVCLQLSQFCLKQPRLEWLTLEDVEVGLHHRQLSAFIDKATHHHLLSSASSACEQTLALSTTLPHVGDWMNCVPAATVPWGFISGIRNSIVAWIVGLAWQYKCTPPCKLGTRWWPFQVLCNYCFCVHQDIFRSQFEQSIWDKRYWANNHFITIPRWNDMTCWVMMLILSTTIFSLLHPSSLVSLLHWSSSKNAKNAYSEFSHALWISYHNCLG